MEAPVSISSPSPVVPSMAIRRQSATALIIAATGSAAAPESTSTYELVEDPQGRIVSDHPPGVSRQLHECIVAHSLGEAILDRNVQVNRHALQTDAGHLTRSLVLEPRASVNVKPNLQIIADDVKCSH
ncbi:hypothetical protein RJ640_027031 [Escallonia rubra]|uniref:SUF system FeS cluster assembly SufBD core domain-containing protein n=1 Tax=Escallonia rubra TaxID=112253 RepID=A0AA88U1Z4_9ASTE|nr:hypothetical protein RJ640_027031 [Escallonia rubra]